jgi:hypothetical protein
MLEEAARCAVVIKQANEVGKAAALHRFYEKKWPAGSGEQFWIGLTTGGYIAPDRLVISAAMSGTTCSFAGPSSPGSAGTSPNDVIGALSDASVRALGLAHGTVVIFGDGVARYVPWREVKSGASSMVTIGTGGSLLASLK